MKLYELFIFHKVVKPAAFKFLKRDSERGILRGYLSHANHTACATGKNDFDE
jgi:hypothetical protein